MSLTIRNNFIPEMVFSDTISNDKDLLKGKIILMNTEVKKLNDHIAACLCFFGRDTIEFDPNDNCEEYEDDILSSYLDEETGNGD